MKYFFCQTSSSHAFQTWYLSTLDNFFSIFSIFEHRAEHLYLINAKNSCKQILDRQINWCEKFITFFLVQLDWVWKMKKSYKQA